MFGGSAGLFGTSKVPRCFSAAENPSIFDDISTLFFAAYEIKPRSWTTQEHSRICIKFKSFESTCGSAFRSSSCIEGSASAECDRFNNWRVRQLFLSYRNDFSDKLDQQPDIPKKNWIKRGYGPQQQFIRICPAQKPKFIGVQSVKHGIFSRHNLFESGNNHNYGCRRGWQLSEDASRESRFRWKFQSRQTIIFRLRHDRHYG